MDAKMLKNLRFIITKIRSGICNFKNTELKKMKTNFLIWSLVLSYLFLLYMLFKMIRTRLPN